MISDLLLTYIACTKATELWFHAAHHVTKGKGFAGDHNILYSKIYNLLGEDLDSLVEKGIGLYDEEQLACPIIISKLASKMVCNFDSPVNRSDDEIANIALHVLGFHLNHLEGFYNNIQSSHDFSIGFDDLLASMANEYERYIYMLKQRIK
jgi:DNA-binding ferritin-like protein